VVKNLLHFGVELLDLGLDSVDLLLGLFHLAPNRVNLGVELFDDLAKAFLDILLDGSDKTHPHIFRLNVL